MNKTILTLIVTLAISFISITSVVAKDKDEKKEGKNSCKKECGVALNKCNTETSKIDKAKKDERKANHEKCQKEFTECKTACK